MDETKIAAAGHLIPGLEDTALQVGFRCFGCGTANPHGLALDFAWNEETQEVRCRFQVASHFEGPPGYVHGGIIATILDEAMGKPNKPKGIIALTRNMEIDYLLPVPLGTWLTVTGRSVSADGRKHRSTAEISNDAGDVLARGKALFIAIDPRSMFASSAG